MMSMIDAIIVQILIATFKKATRTTITNNGHFHPSQHPIYTPNSDTNHTITC